MQEIPALNLPEPHINQIPVLKAIFDERYKYIVLDCGRQWGKSYAVGGCAPAFAITNRNVVVLYVTPKIQQVTKVYEEILAAYENIPGLIIDNKAQGGIAVIEFNTGSKILFRSTAQKNALRGLTAHYIILDECAFMDEEVINKIIKPMGTTSIKKIIAASTPAGKNFFYKWYLRGQSSDYEDRYWVSFKYTSYDNPFADKEYLDEQRYCLSEQEFNQEYLAEFVSSASVFANINELSDLEPLLAPPKDENGKTGRYYAGVDIGMVSDATVISVVDGNGNLVNYYRYSNVSAAQIRYHIIEANKIWKFDRIMVEINNQGRPIYEDLLAELNNLVDFTTTSVNKGIIINDLIFLFNTKAIHLMKDTNKPHMQNELEAFEFKQSNTGYTRYEAASGFNDDCVISLALAVHCARQYGYRGYYNSFYRF